MVIKWHAVTSADEIRLIEYETKIAWDFTYRTYWR